MFTVNKLKISGFKSFAHPTELLIEDGVTGIVGPNGCGKSNVFEAIRWVMGESSSKSLRSGSMDDVIFNGTQSIPAKNFAEVDFNNQIISSINNIITDLIKSQNLIDVKTPSFLNVAIKLNKKKSNLAEFNNRIKKIDLIDNYYVQQINKDYVLVKIRYLGKIDKIINKLKKQDISLKMIEGQWQLNII